MFSWGSSCTTEASLPFEAPLSTEDINTYLSTLLNLILYEFPLSTQARFIINFCLLNWDTKTILSD